MYNLIARVYNSIKVHGFNLLKIIVLFETYFFLYEKFQSQVGKKVVCQDGAFIVNPFTCFNL